MRYLSTFLLFMPMVMRRTRVRRARSAARNIRAYAPRLSRVDTRDVRLEKAGVDTVCRLITDAIAAVNNVTVFTFAAGATDGKLAFNPMDYLYTSSAAFLA